MRQVQLAITEEAQKLLRVTRADFVKVSEATTIGRGSGFVGSAFGTYKFEQVRKQGEYLRLVSIVEAYIDTCSNQQFELRMFGRDDFVRALAAEVQETSLKGWEERKRTFKAYHGVILGQCARWSDIDAAREVRNSIAHGLGRLTPRQRAASLRARMRDISVVLRGDEILITDVALERCLTSAIDFITDVDRKLTLRT